MPDHFHHYAQRIRETLTQLLASANEQLDTCFDLPEVMFDLKGKSAGQCIYEVNRPHKSQLRFNLDICNAYPEAFIAHTPAHELAHFLTYSIFGTGTRRKKLKPHGREWRYIMEEVLKVEAKTYHEWETQPARKLKYHPFICQCEGRVHELSSIRTNRMLSGKATYHCTDCREVLVPVPELAE